MPFLGLVYDLLFRAPDSGSECCHLRTSTRQPSIIIPAAALPSFGSFWLDGSSSLRFQEMAWRKMGRTSCCSFSLQRYLLNFLSGGCVYASIGHLPLPVSFFALTNPHSIRLGRSRVQCPQGMPSERGKEREGEREREWLH